MGVVVVIVSGVIDSLVICVLGEAVVLLVAAIAVNRSVRRLDHGGHSKGTQRTPPASATERRWELFMVLVGLATPQALVFGAVFGTRVGFILAGALVGLSVLEMSMLLPVRRMRRTRNARTP